MVARFCGKETKTKVIDDDNDPEWYQSLVLDVDVPCYPMRCRPKIYCEIFDEDNVKKDESLGRFAVPQPNVDKPMTPKEFVKKLMPQWFSLTDAEGNKVDGEVLVEFQLMEPYQFDFSPSPNLNVFRMSAKTRAINVITIGLRDIQSTFVNKPYIEFECRGDVEQTKESNVPSSRNPNFNIESKLVIASPKRPTFLPNLKLIVKDSVCRDSKVPRKLH